MGATRVTVTVRNPAEPHRTWDGLFLVDPGAINCLAPRKHLEAIGLAPKGQRRYRLEDGSEARMDFTTAVVEFMGDFAGTTIVMGEDDVEPLLGLTVLESVGIEVDPVNQTLKRMPYVRMRGIRTPAERRAGINRRV